MDRVEQYAEKIHPIAHKAGKEYAASHGNSVVEEVAYGRGFKAGTITGYRQAEKDIAQLAQLWVDSGDANIMSFEKYLKER